MRELLLFHIYSGQLFFTAAALFLLAALLEVRYSSAARVGGLLSIPLAALSGTPLPSLIWIPTLALTLAFVFIAGQKHRLKPVLHTSAIFAVLVAVAIELPYHVRRGSIQRPTRLIVIGDSLSSGGFGEKTAWPDLLGAPVINLSLPSDTTAGAVRNQIPRLPPPLPGDLVIIEIGGNDMLEGLPAQEFERSLDKILTAAASRQTVMLELPIIPGRWRYGAIQRRVAAEHRVLLAPKRILARVLTDSRNTTDGLHLTQRGHQELANAIDHSVRRK